MDPFTTALIVGTVSKAIGKAFGRLVDVDSPRFHYGRYLQGVRKAEIPSYLTSEEIRDMAYQSSSMHPVVAGMSSAAAIAVKAGKPAIHAHRAARAIEMNVGRSLQGINSVLKIQATEQKLKDLSTSLGGQMQQQELSDRFKSGLADEAAMRGVVKYEEQIRHRQSVESAVGGTAQVVALLAGDPEFRKWISKLLESPDAAGGALQGGWDLDTMSHFA